MGSSEKRSKDVVMNDIPTFSAENFQKNLKVIQNRSVSFNIPILSLSLVFNSFMFLTMLLLCLVLQPDLSVYYCWSPCRNYWIHWLDRLCVLHCGDADHITWAHGQGRLLSWRVLWFMEPGPFWWLPWWPYGTLYFPFSCNSSVKFLYVTFQISH